MKSCFMRERFGWINTRMQTRLRYPIGRRWDSCGGGLRFRLHLCALESHTFVRGVDQRETIRSFFVLICVSSSFSANSASSNQGVFSRRSCAYEVDRTRRRRRRKCNQTEQSATSHEGAASTIDLCEVTMNFASTVCVWQDGHDSIQLTTA
jgi:hypothetical protein